MIFLRGLTYALPQILLFLLIGARANLIFGLNKTDLGFSLLILFFLMIPVTSAILLLTEIIIYWKKSRSSPGSRSFLFPGLALFLLLESLVIDIFILANLKMH